MTNFPTPYSVDSGPAQVWRPMLLVAACHLLLFGLVVFKAHMEPGIDFNPSALNVQMVSLADLPAAAKEQAAAVATQTPEKAEPPQAATAPEANPSKDTAQPEISIAPQPKTKTALKYKTYKPEKVLEKTMQRLEQKVAATPQKSLADTFKRLREEVAKGEKSVAGEEKGTGQAVDGTPQGTGTAAFGPAAGGVKGQMELVDMYRLEIAYQVQKNWAFAEQMGGGGKQMMASIVFKVMPDGAIQDIFFTDRSGNTYLDDSAYKAIIKSSPLKPHPAGLRAAYIEMGLRFTPEGVR